MNHFSALIKPASSTCTLRCRYCFYEEESAHRETANHGVMREDVMMRLIDQVLGYFKTETTIQFAFQGGEPTCAGLGWYRKFVDYVNRKKKDFHHVHYSIQTNGILLDQEWIEFLKQNDFLVGISIDGPEMIHDHFRIDAYGNGSYEKVMNSLELLRCAGVEFNVLSVLTSKLSQHPQEYWDWVRRNNLSYVQLTPCIPSCENDPMALKPEDFFSFYDQIFPLWFEDLKAQREFHVSLFDNLILLFAGHLPEQCGFLGKCSSQFVMEADGSCYPCDFYCLDRFYMGNGSEQSPRQLSNSKALKKFLKEPRRKCSQCSDCRFEGICHRQCKRLNVCYFDRNFCGYRRFLEKYQAELGMIASIFRNG